MRCDHGLLRRLACPRGLSCAQLFIPALTLALALALMTGGCRLSSGRYFEYIPPDTQEGAKCVAACIKDKKSCRKEAYKEYEGCLDDRLAAVQAEKACGRDGARETRDEKSDEKQENANESELPCGQDFPLCTAPDVVACDKVYNQCYEDCGGIVRKGR